MAMKEESMLQEQAAEYWKKQYLVLIPIFRNFRKIKISFLIWKIEA